MDNREMRQNSLSPIEGQTRLKPKGDRPTTEPGPQLSQPYISRSRRRHRSELKIKLLQIALGSLIFLFSLIILLMWLYTSKLSAENDQISAEFYKQARQLTATTEALEKLQGEMKTLLQGRLPHLVPLEYDKAIPITHKYLRNIIFTLIKAQGRVATEYRVVLQNDTLSVIHPEVKILLFDHVGIQIGSAEIISTALTADEAVLDPGEVRSYSGSIELFQEGDPHYFLVTAR